MAGIEDWSNQEVVSWLSNLSFEQYTKSFTDLKIKGDLIKKLTNTDLQKDLNIQDPQVCSLLYSLIHLNQDKRPAMHLTYTLNHKKFSFPLNFSSFSIGGGQSSDFFVPSAEENQCLVIFDPNSQKFFIEHKGPGKSYIKLSKVSSLEQGEIFCIGENEVKVEQFWFNQLGKKILCELDVGGSKIRVGRGGVSFGRSANCGVVLNGNGVRGFHAVVGEEFELECFHCCFEVMRTGFLYPIFLGSVVKVGDVEVVFE